MRNYIVEVNVFIAPLKVVDNPFVCQFFLYDEKILEKLNDSLVDVKMVEFCYHGLLIFQIFFVLVNQSIALIDYAPDVVEDLRIGLLFEIGECVIKGLIFSLFPLELEVHVFNLSIVPL